MQNLRWDDLRVLLALHRRGSLHAAAHDLSVNVSTVGRRLDALEAAVGLHLFDRTPGGTQPTQAADELLPHAEAMERSALGIAHAVDGLEAEPEGLVRLAAPPGLAEQFLAGAIGELLARHPRLRVEILSSIGYADLTRREADLALRTVKPASGDLVARRLGTAPFALAAAPRLAESLGALRDLDDATWITYGEDLAHMPDCQWVTAQVSGARLVLRTSSMTAQIEAARGGVGVVPLPRPFLRLPGLSPVRLARSLARRVRPLPEGALWLVGHRALRHVPRIAATWTFLERSIAERL